jgi:hypothetical protein
MRYKRWTDADGDLEAPIAELWTEIDERGEVTREIGLDRDGHVVHLMPAVGFKHGTYGLFDLAPVDPTPAPSDLAPTQFETVWCGAMRAVPSTSSRPPILHALLVGAVVLGTFFAIVGAIAVAVWLFVFYGATY